MQSGFAGMFVLRNAGSPDMWIAFMASWPLVITAFFAAQTPKSLDKYRKSIPYNCVIIFEQNGM